MVAPSILDVRSPAMKKAVLVLVSFGIAACSQTGEEYVCYDKRAEENILAVSRVDPWSGDVSSYVARDANGLSIEITEANSHDFDCTSRSDIEEARQEWWNANRGRCLDEAAEIRAMATGTSAERRLKEAKARLHEAVCRAP